MLADLETWLREERARLSRSAAIAKPIDYMLRRWDRFARFVEDGRICLTNNAAERALRGSALGRKSWLFAGSDRGAARAAAMATLIATERNEPEHRPRIDWKLITDLPVRSHDDAVEKLVWYAMRWKIETFHKILKSGCKAEEARLRTAQRLVKLIAVFCILAWRLFWMTMINRSQPHAKAELAITDIEMKLLDHLLPDKTQPHPAPGPYPAIWSRLPG